MHQQVQNENDPRLIKKQDLGQINVSQQKDSVNRTVQDGEQDISDMAKIVDQQIMDNLSHLDTDRHPNMQVCSQKQQNNMKQDLFQQLFVPGTTCLQSQPLEQCAHSDQYNYMQIPEGNCDQNQYNICLLQGHHDGDDNVHVQTNYGDIQSAGRQIQQFSREVQSPQMPILVNITQQSKEQQQLQQVGECQQILIQVELSDSSYTHTHAQTPACTQTNNQPIQTHECTQAIEQNKLSACQLLNSSNFQQETGLQSKMDPFTHDPLTIDFRSVKEPQVLSIEKADAMLNAPLSKKIVTEHNENLNLEQDHQGYANLQYKYNLTLPFCSRSGATVCSTRTAIIMLIIIAIIIIFITDSGAVSLLRQLKGTAQKLCIFILVGLIVSVVGVQKYMNHKNLNCQEIPELDNKSQNRNKRQGDIVPNQ